MLRDEYTLLLEKLGEYFGRLKSFKETEIAAIDDVLLYLYQNAVDEYDVDKITWEEVEGPRGRYERASEDSVDFNLLLKDLEQHEGKFSHGNQFYWLFDNARVVGRKPR